MNHGVLKSVPDEQPEPPYPSDTKHNGFRQEVDWQRIQQSKTWIMADAEVRPWLLMVWFQSWQNVPVGTWEPDDEYISRCIGCNLNFFRGHREQLMRGWRRHGDGLLYHPYIVSQVKEMLGKRRKATERQRKRRTRKGGEEMSRVTPSDSRDEPGDSRIATRVVRVGTGTGTGTGEDLSSPLRSEDCAENLPFSTRPAAPRCPYEEILELWRRILPELLQPHDVEHWTPARKQRIRNRWNNELPDLEAWQQLMLAIRESDFLMGRKSTSTGTPCDIDWVTKPENLQKIAEGKYFD